MLAAQTFVYVVKGTQEILSLRTVATLMNVTKMISQHVGSTQFVRTFQEVTNVLVLLDQTEIHSTSVKNAIALNANVNHLINWLVEIAFLLVVLMETNVEREQNVSRLLVV